MRRPCFWVCVLPSLFCALFSSLTMASTPTIIPTSVSTVPDIDGHLDEPVWKTAGVIKDLIQQNPTPGAPTPYTTEVLVLVDTAGLTFGFRCADPQPANIAVHTLQRDGTLSGDDSVALVLDTFHDGRRGYYFRINAAGARQDGLITGPEDASLDWDGIWDAAAQRTPTGWTAEIRIPAQTLRFNPDSDQWGLNLERVVARDRLTLRWADHSLDAGLYDLRRAGVLAGTGIMRQGLGLTVSPFATARADKAQSASSHQTNSDLGGDLNWNITSQLSASVTVNTDFAETEVDTRRINLTRFPLFFPEKRGFFLEGSDQFAFGAGLGSDFLPFFSRRIGLYEGLQIPIDAGVKVLGRSGRWGIGAVGVHTAGTAAGPNDASLFSGRVTYDLNRHLTVGTIATHGDPDGVADNSLVGMDANWQTSTLGGDKNFSLGTWVALSRGDGHDHQRYGWGFKMDYPNDLWDAALIYKEFGTGLNPALGFLPRPGTRWLSGGVSFQPRPNDGALAWIRQFYFELYPQIVWDLDGGTESWRVFTAPLNFQTESGEHIEANFAPQYEHLDEGFEVAEGKTIPAGGYTFSRFRVEAQSSRSRAVRAGSTVWFGDFYTGTLTQWESFLTYASNSGHWQLELSAENDFGELPQGGFTTRWYGFKFVYAFSPDLILSSYTQYDSESREVGRNTRLRWTLAPGNDLYLVWNLNLHRPENSDGWSGLNTLDDHLVTKLRWTLRW